MYVCFSFYRGLENRRRMGEVTKSHRCQVTHVQETCLSAEGSTPRSAHQTPRQPQGKAGALRSEFCLQNCRTPAPLEFHSRFRSNKRMCSFKRSHPFLEPGAWSLSGAGIAPLAPGCALGPSGRNSVFGALYLCNKVPRRKSGMSIQNHSQKGEL